MRALALLVMLAAASAAIADGRFLGAVNRPIKASEANVSITICQQEPSSRLWSCFGMDKLTR